MNIKKILLTLILIFSFSFADITDSFPKLSGQVVDNANLLSQTQKETLVSIIKSHEEETSNQIVVLTLNSLDGYEIAEYSYQLGRYWEIGQKDKDNGVLLVISLNDRKLRIEVGYGLEGALTDKISHEIIEYTLKPKFRETQYYQGIQGAVNQIILAIKGEYTQDNKTNTNNNDISFIPLVFFIVIFSSLGLNGLSRSKRNPSLYRITKASLNSSFISIFIYAFSFEFTSYSLFISLISFLIIFIISFLSMKKIDFDKIQRDAKNTSSSYGSGYSGGFSSSGGGFSGGGGSFGGGGASGGW